MKKVTFTLLKQIIEDLDKFAIHPTLKSLTLHNCDGRPTFIAGGMAMVAKMKDSSGNAVALKVWLQKPTAHISERYAKMKTYQPLKDVILYGDYLPDGIKVGTQTLDAYVSPWLSDYIPLHEYVGFHKQDAQAIGRIARSCEDVFKKMKTLGLVHGDLHSENITVGRGGDIKIIDLDSLTFGADLPCTSSIKGLPVYQHPQRTNTLYTNTDDVSMLSILTSLHATASGMARFLQYSFADDLGITQRDISKPRQSSLLQELKQYKNEAGVYAHLLLEALTQGYDREKSLFVKSKNEVLSEDIRSFFKQKAEAISTEQSHRFTSTNESIKQYFENKSFNP